MIHAEKKKNGLAIRASGNPEEIIRELGEITASIFAEILIDDMTEAEWDDCWEKWTALRQEETMNRKEAIKNASPDIVRKVRIDRKWPWE